MDLGFEEDLKKAHSTAKIRSFGYVAGRNTSHVAALNEGLLFFSRLP